MHASPYRPAPPAAFIGRLRVVFWPCFGVWPIVVALVVAVPAAFWAREEDRLPSVVVCTNARASVGNDGNCTTHDAHTLATFTNVPCKSTPAAVDAFLDSPNPLKRPIVYANELGPATPELVKRSAIVDGRRDIDARAARALIRDCANAPPSPMATLTVQLIIIERDYTRSLVVFLVLLAGALGAGLRRRVTVTLDPASPVLHIAEHGLFAPKQTMTVATNDIEDVIVSTAPNGWRRVELVLRNGGRMPVTTRYAPFTRSAHDGFAHRLRGALATTRPVGA